MRKKTQIGLLVGGIILLVASILWIKYSEKSIDDLPQITENGRLSVLTDSSSIGFSIAGDSVKGFQYEIVKAFADSIGVELVISEQNDLKACIDGLQNGDYNLIASFIPITTQWKGELSFSNPLFTSNQVLVQQIKSDSTASIATKSHFDLANDTIVLPLHSPYKSRIEHLSDEIAENITIVEMKNVSTEQLVRMVAQGKIKHTICERNFANKLKTQYPSIDISLPIGFEQQQVWAVHPNSPLLLEKLNAFLSDFIGSSAYWQIYRKYY